MSTFMFKYLNHDLRLLKFNEPLHFFAEMPLIIICSSSSIVIVGRVLTKTSSMYSLEGLIWNYTLNCTMESHFPSKLIICVCVCQVAREECLRPHSSNILPPCRAQTEEEPNRTDAAAPAPTTHSLSREQRQASPRTTSIITQVSLSHTILAPL